MPDFGAFLRRVDATQQRFTPTVFVVGVAKKFGDDRGGALAAQLTYYGFLSIFPALLILTTVLGFIGNRDVSKSVIGSTLSQFPVLGEQIGKNVADPLSGSGLGLGLGLLLLLYGLLGSTQAAQNAMAQVWNVPAVARPGFLPRLGRGALFVGTFGIAMVVSVLLSGLVTVAGQSLPARVLSFVVMVALNVAIYLAAFRVLTPGAASTRELVPGAVLGGIGYSVLLNIGTALVQHQLKHSQAVYGQFALVLGLMAWLAFVAQLTVYAAEVNVVIARRLWPRGITAPLVAADKQVSRDLAHQEERIDDERVAVGFAPDRVGEAAQDAASLSPLRTRVAPVRLEARPRRQPAGLWFGHGGYKGLMSEQFIVIVALVLSFVAVVAGGSYVFAATAETEPEQPRPRSTPSVH